MNDKYVDFSIVESLDQVISRLREYIVEGWKWDYANGETLEDGCNLRSDVKALLSIVNPVPKPVTTVRRLAKQLALTWQTMNKEEQEVIKTWLTELDSHADDTPISSNKDQAYRNCLQGAENLMGKMLTVIAACRDTVTYRDFAIAFQCWQEEKEGL